MKKENPSISSGIDSSAPLELPVHKIKSRSAFLALRKQLSQERRFFAAQAIYQEIIRRSYRHILSFFPIRSEIDLNPLNLDLAKQKRLILPRVEGKALIPYQVTDFRHLTLSPLGIPEPNPSLCPPISPHEIEAILVPGLAFDQSHHRLGYGKGFYDRFLKGLSTETIGVGFKEQWSLIPLPRDPWDLPLKTLLLF